MPRGAERSRRSRPGGAQHWFAEAGELRFAKLVELLASFVVVALDFLSATLRSARSSWVAWTPVGFSESLAELIDDGWFHDVFPLMVAPEFGAGWFVFC